MATQVSQGATGNAYIDGVLSGVKWSGTVTYSFPDSAADYPGGYGSGEQFNDFAQISAQQQTAVHSIMQQIGNYTNLTITFAGTDGADIRMAHSDNANPTAYAYYPSNATDGEGGDVWFGDGYTNPIVGNYQYATHVHELGHSFGLKHGHETGGPSNVAVPADRDALEFTVMTYRSYVGGPTTGYTNETFGYPQTFMMLDIAALQTMYGADYTTNSGNTIYTWSPTTGEMFLNGAGQGQPGGNRVFLTTWDGGGNDTYNMSNYSNDVTIDLTPGSWSVTSQTQKASLGSGYFAQGNVYNALLFQGNTASLIENATGGSGNDTLIGNAAGNVLYGGPGNDQIFWSAGGGDIFDGSSGGDYARFDNATSSLTADLMIWGNNAGAAAGDAFVSIEAVIGSGFSDDIRGDDNTNILVGLAGDDILTGRAGDDYLAGGAGNDQMFGGVGTDQLFGNTGADAFDGGDGGDWVRYDDAGSAVFVDWIASGLNQGEAAGDTYVAVEALVGSNFSDTLRGNAVDNIIVGLSGDDTLVGQGGNDYLTGDAGFDVLDGGTGSDTLVGGSADDIFNFYAQDANGDAVIDFNGNGAASGDRFQFVGYGAGATFTQIDATHWLIKSADNSIQDTITLSNGASIHASDYVFV